MHHKRPQYFAERLLRWQVCANSTCIIPPPAKILLLVGVTKSKPIPFLPQFLATLFSPLWDTPGRTSRLPLHPPMSAGKPPPKFHCKPRRVLRMPQSPMLNSSTTRKSSANLPRHDSEPLGPPCPWAITISPLQPLTPPQPQLLLRPCMCSCRDPYQPLPSHPTLQKCP